MDHSKFLHENSRYSPLFKLDPLDYKGWATGLKKAGYATSPTYDQKLIGLIEKYNLQEYDRKAYNMKAVKNVGVALLIISALVVAYLLIRKLF